MPNWKKILTSGSDASLNTLIVTNGITGSLFGTASYAMAASSAVNTQDILIYIKNSSGTQINKGKVVQIVGAVGDNALIGTASYSSDNTSANTLGITNENIAHDSFGYVMTEGTLLGIDTSTFTAGQLIYLGATGSIIGIAPLAPLHAVRLGQVLRSQLNNGSIYIRIDNGFELGELHDVLDNTTTGSYGDLLVKSGSIWINSKQLTGSYVITGSLIATSFTGSLQGTTSTASFVTLAQTASFVTLAQTASFVTTAQTASFVLQAVSASFATTASFVTTAQTASRVTSSGVFGPNGANSILTSSFATTASFVLQAVSASFATLAQTASFVTTAQTASFVLQAVSASFATTSSTVITNANLTGVVTSIGNATAIADAALSIAKTSGLQSALDLKAPLATPTFTTNITTPLIIGGTAVGSTLTYKTTTGVGTTDAHIFQVGNNGTTESMRILNSGNVGIGTTTPDYGSAGTNFTTLSILGKGTTQFSGGVLELATQGTDADNNSIGAISFVATANTATKQLTSQIAGYTSGTTANNRGGDLTFSTKPDAITSLVERMWISKNGDIGIGVEPTTGYSLHIGKNLTGSASPVGVFNNGKIQSSTTTDVAYFQSQASTAAGAYVIPSLYHYYFSTSALGAGSSITNQYGYFASAITQATNNYGFYGNLSSGTGRYNIFMNGTAQNFFNGNVGIGVIIPTAVLHLKAGTATANTAPLKFTTGATMSIAEAGSVEFLTDAYYGTITTGAARKSFAFLESPTFTGTPTLPTGTIATTQASNTNNTTVATTAYVDRTQIFSATASLSSAQIKALFTTPIQIVANPGSGKYIEVISATSEMTFATAAYTTNTTLQIISSGSNVAQVEDPVALLSTVSRNSKFVDVTIGTLATTETQILSDVNLVVKAKTGNPGVGAGTAKIKLLYRIVTI